MAVMQLGRNKSLGPDGIPSEFFQLYWSEIKPYILNMVQDFYRGTLDLKAVNHANIIMIAKKEAAERVGDYRPISVINIIPKLISKLLANRLKNKLPDLISVNQTAFIRGRQIAENFFATREILQHLEKNKKPAIFFKLILRKHLIQ